MRCQTILLLALVLLMVAPVAAAAQGRPPALGEITDARSLEAPFYFPYQDAAQVIQEWSRPGRYLYVNNQINWLVPQTQDLAPRLFLRNNGLDVSAGTQLLVGATPFHDALTFQGARLAGHADAVTWTAYAGRTANPDAALVSGEENPQRIAGATLGYRPDPYQSWGASVLQYAPPQAGGLPSTVAMLQGFLSDRATWSLLSAYGYDLGHRLPGESPGERRALRIQGLYNQKRVSASLDWLDWGGLFGPAGGLVDPRGTSSINGIAQYRLSRDLVFTESFRRNGAGQPGVARQRRTLINDWQHRLTWYPGPTSHVEMGYEDNTAQSGGAPRLAAHAIFLQGSAFLSKRFTISGDARLERLPDSSRRTQVRLRGRIPLSEGLSLTAEQGLFRTDLAGGGFDRTLQSTLGVRYFIPDERGSASLLLQRQTSRAGGVPSAGNGQNATLSFLYRPFGTVFLGADLNMGQTAGAASTSSGARMRWIAGPTSDLELVYNFRSSGQTIMVDSQLRELRHIVGLTLRHSFGGPIETALRKELEGRVAARVMAAPAGDTRGRLVPVPGVPVMVGSRVVRTDAKGQALLQGIEAGRYPVRIAPGGLGPNYEPLGPGVAHVDVPPGETARLDFRSTAYASVYAVVWDDPAGSGTLGTPYTPLTGIRLRLAGNGGSASNADGIVEFRRLKPGRYEVEVDPSTVPHGLASTTPARQTIVLAPGQEVVASFGFQGFGTLQGRVLAIPRLGREPTRAIASMAVTVDGQIAGRTDAEGRYRLRVPAGGHTVSLDTAELGSARYVPSAPFRVDVQPDQALDRNMAVAERAQIAGRLLELRTDGSRAPIPLGGVVILFTPPGEPSSFAYTDEHGGFIFERLTLGRYTVGLDPASLPAGWASRGPTSVVADLASGEVRSVEFVLVRQPPAH